MSAILEVKGFSFSYEEDCKVLKEIELSFEKGRFYGIVGPNGSGKSTLLRSLDRQLPISKKTIYLKGQDITTLKEKELAREISFVPQNTEVTFELTVEDIVMMGRTPYLNLFSNEKEGDHQVVAEALEKTGTATFKKRFLQNLSGGERQRVILARALAQEGDIILLDEPVSQLDIHYQLEVMQLLRQLVDTEKITAICVLHDLNLASMFCDELIVLKEGELFAKGIPKEVLTEDLIQEVYGVSPQILEHPVNRNPVIVLGRE